MCCVLEQACGVQGGFEETSLDMADQFFGGWRPAGDWVLNQSNGGKK